MASPVPTNLSNNDSATNVARTTNKMKESGHEYVIHLPDGKCGWFVMAASLLCLLISDGILFSFGLIVSGSDHVFYKTFAKRVLFFSYVNGSSFGSGYLISKLSNRFGFLIIMIAKTLLSFLGLLTYSISQSFNRLLFMQIGLVFGVVDVLSTTSFVVEDGKRRTLVTGIALCCSGTGALVFAPGIYFLNEKFANLEAFYYLSCFYLVCALFGWLYGPFYYLRRRTSNLNEVKEIPQNQGTDQEQPGNGKQTLKHDYVKITITDRPANSNEIKEVPQNQMTTEEQPGNDKVNPGNMEHQNGSDPIIQKSKLERFKNYLWGKFLRFKSATFVAISIVSFLQAFGLFVPIVHLPAHAISIGISKVEAFFLISAIGISSTIGRIFNGWLSDQPNFDVLLWNTVGLSVTGVWITFGPLFTSCRWLVVFSVLFGLVSSCSIVSHPIVLGKQLESKDVTNNYGFVHICYRAGAFTGILVAGLLYIYYDHYHYSFYVAGFFVRLSAVLCLYLERINGWERRRND